MNYRNILISLAALSGTISASAWSAESATVAFLMPDQASTRYEQHDFPGFKAEMSKLCADCKVIYQNANANASLQQQQFNSVITQGAKVIVLDPVDSSAAAALVENAQAQGVKVIAYDRPVPNKPADFYVSFDNEGIGYAIAKSLTDHLKASGVPEDAGVLQINGSPTDAASRADSRRYPSRAEGVRLQNAGGIRHPGVGAAESAGVDCRTSDPLRR